MTASTPRPSFRRRTSSATGVETGSMTWSAPRAIARSRRGAIGSTTMSGRMPASRHSWTPIKPMTPRPLMTAASPKRSRDVKCPSYATPPSARKTTDLWIGSVRRPLAEEWTTVNGRVAHERVGVARGAGPRDVPNLETLDTRTDFDHLSNHLVPVPHWIERRPITTLAKQPIVDLVIEMRCGAPVEA